MGKDNAILNTENIKVEVIKKCYLFALSTTSAENLNF